MNVAGNVAAEDRNSLWPKSQNSVRNFNQNAVVEAVRGRGIPGTISVATIRFAGQPSHDARRASAPTAIMSFNILTPLAGQIRRTATPSVQQNSSIAEPASERIRVPRKTSNRGPSKRYLFILGMCDLLP